MIKLAWIVDRIPESHWIPFAMFAKHLHAKSPDKNSTESKHNDACWSVSNWDLLYSPEDFLMADVNPRYTDSICLLENLSTALALSENWRIDQASKMWGVGMFGEILSFSLSKWIKLSEKPPQMSRNKRKMWKIAHCAQIQTIWNSLYFLNSKMVQFCNNWKGVFCDIS